MRSIGKAGKAVTKQVGKALTKISESPDKRGQDKAFLVQNPQFLSTGQQGLAPGLGDGRKADLGMDSGT